MTFTFGRSAWRRRQQVESNASYAGAPADVGQNCGEFTSFQMATSWNGMRTSMWWRKPQYARLLSASSGASEGRPNTEITTR